MKRREIKREMQEEPKHAVQEVIHTATLEITRTEDIDMTVSQWRDAVSAQTDLVGKLRTEVLNLQVALKDKEVQLYIATERLRAISYITKTT